MQKTHYQKLYYKNHKEAILEYQKKRYIQKYDKIRQYQKVYFKKYYQIHKHTIQNRQRELKNLRIKILKPPKLIKIPKIIKVKIEKVIKIRPIPNFTIDFD